MDLSWVQGLLQLLFGQLGAVGTILVAACAYIAWLFKTERESHEATRKQMQELGEKRFAVIFENFKVMEGFKGEIEELTNEVRRAK